jgi:perosamine synthetase
MAALAAPALRVPLTRPYLGPEEEQAVAEVLRSGWLAQGPRVAEFERCVAEYVGARHAVATSNGTTALQLALTALGIGPGDEVVVPSLTFIATANAVLHAGATPVFVDVEPGTYTMDPEAAAAAVTPRTRALMPVHQLGLAADMDRLSAVARRHGLLVLEDAAPALGATYRDRRIGGLGHPATFSFHPRKVVTTGEGGMLVTDDAALAERARLLRAHGMSVSDLARHHASQAIVERYPVVGYNHRLSDVHAAIGLVQMARLPFVLERRRQVAARYAQGLGGRDDLELPADPAHAPHTYQSYMVRLRPGRGPSRDALMDAMLAAGVATRRGLMAVHLEPAYRGSAPPPRLPVTEAATRETLLLPIFASLTEAEQDHVIEHLIEGLGA